MKEESNLCQAAAMEAELELLSVALYLSKKENMSEAIVKIAKALELIRFLALKGGSTDSEDHHEQAA